MASPSNIINSELYIHSILSVAQKQYDRREFAEPDVNIRKEDLFVCVLEGESIYHLDTGARHLYPGDVIFLPCGCRYHREIVSDFYQTILVYFHFVKDPELALIPSVFPSIQGLDLEFVKLSSKWNSRGLCTQSECACLLYGIYMRLIRSETSAYLPNTKRELFESAVEKLIESYTAEDFSLAALAAQAEMSEVHFRRCFKQIYHVSPQQYLMELRLTRAKELLQFDNTSVTEIARKSGFVDPCYFSRVFKQKTGYAPSEYRTVFGTPHPD